MSGKTSFIIKYALDFLDVVFLLHSFIELTVISSESEFNEFEPRLKSAKNRFQLSAGLNLENAIQF